MKIKTLALTLMILSACSSLPVPSSPGPAPSPVVTPSPVVSSSPAPVVSKEWPILRWQPEYSDFVKQKTPEFLLANEPAGYEPTSFCSSYHELSREQRKQFWADFWQNVAQVESANSKGIIDRTLQYLERQLEGVDDPIDEVTGNPVLSEGLLQLSYQDKNSYSSLPTCAKFNWSKDKSLPLKDRTIADPLINLGCGIEIMEWTLKRNPHATFASRSAAGAYWSTIRDHKVKVPAICD